MTPLDRALAGLRPSTARAYRDDLELLVPSLGVESFARELFAMPRARAEELARAFVAKMLVDELAPRTIRRRLSALRSVVRRAYEIGLCEYELRTRAPLQIAPVRYHVTRAEIANVQAAAAAAGGREAARDVAMLRCSYDLGLRVAELVGLELEDLAIAPALLGVTRKGGERHEIHVPRPTLLALRVWLEQRPEAGDRALFVSLARGSRPARISARGWRARLAELCDRAELGRRLSPHAFRHAAITLAADAGASPYSLRAWAGHKRIATTIDVYDDGRDRGADVADLLASLVPVALPSVVPTRVLELGPGSS